MRLWTMLSDGLSRCRILLLSLVIQATLALGHEGHQPLPTKGVQVDLKKGHITLSKAARDVLDVRTVGAEQRDSIERLRAYATIVAPWTKYAVVTSRLPGRVIALHVRPGDIVSAGQLLAEVDSLDLHTLRLNYQQAQNDIDLSEKILAEIEPAAKTGAVPGQKLIEAQQAHRQNLNTRQVLLAKATVLNVEEATLAADDESHPLRLPIRSTVGGVVVHADLAVGKFIEPTEHLMDIVDLVGHTKTVGRSDRKSGGDINVLPVGATTG